MKGATHSTRRAVTSRTGARPSAFSLDGIDPRKLRRAREILGSVSDLEAIEVALDLLVLDDAYAAERSRFGPDDG